MKTKMKLLTHLWLLAFVGHKTRLAWDVPLSLKTRRSEHRNISLKKKTRNESTWIKALCFSDFFYRTQIHTRHFHKAFAYHQSIQVLFQYVLLEGSSYSKVVLVAEQLVYELLKQWTACHPCYSSCVFSCIKIHLRLNYALYFHFFLRGLTFKCIITDQSPKLDNINRSFLAICKEITSSTILERENEIYNESVIQSLWQIC